MLRHTFQTARPCHLQAVVQWHTLTVEGNMFHFSNLKDMKRHKLLVKIFNSLNGIESAAISLIRQNIKTGIFQKLYLIL
jgi:hypothetical protein